MWLARRSQWGAAGEGRRDLNKGRKGENGRGGEGPEVRRRGRSEDLAGKSHGEKGSLYATRPRGRRSSSGARATGRSRAPPLPREAPGRHCGERTGGGVDRREPVRGPLGRSPTRDLAHPTSPLSCPGTRGDSTRVHGPSRLAPRPLARRPYYGSGSLRSASDWSAGSWSPEWVEAEVAGTDVRDECDPDQVHEDP